MSDSRESSLYRWSLRIHPDVTRMLYKIPRKSLEEIWKVFRRLEIERIPEEAELVESLENTYQIMSGKYRIVYELLREEIVVKIIRLHLDE